MTVGLQELQRKMHVSEELSSVETHDLYCKSTFLTPVFQKNLVVWKPHIIETDNGIQLKISFQKNLVV